MPPEEQLTPGSAAPSDGVTHTEHGVPGRDFSAGSRENWCSPAAWGAGLLLTCSLFLPITSRTSLAQPHCSIKHCLFCLSPMKMESNLVYRSLQQPGCEQPLQCCRRTVLEGRVKSSMKSQQGKETMGMARSAAGQRFLSVQLLLGFSSLWLLFKWKL